MKVLWFCNTPCSAVEKLGINQYAGGWLTSLQKNLIKYCVDVELGICFLHTEKMESFNYDNCTFYPIHRPGTGSKLQRLTKRFQNKNDDDALISQCIQIISEFNPDVVHIHGSEECFGLVQKFIKKPCVLSIQGILNPYYEKFFSGITKQEATNSEPLINKLLKKSQSQIHNMLYVKSIREKEILKLTKNIIGRTAWDKRVTSVLNVDRKYFENNEVLRQDFYINRWVPRKDIFSTSFKILTTASDNLYKGFEMIVKCAIFFKNEMGFNFEWNVAGLSGSSSIVQICRSRFKVDFSALGIKLLGANNEKQLISLFLATDLYCQVSHIENSPNSLCEAMILGVPIIASLAGGTDSMLKSSHEGILIQDGDVYSLAGAILECRNEYSKFVEMGANAYAKAHQRHNPESIVTDLVAIYSKII